QKKDDHITTNSIQQFFYKAKKLARIIKPASVHTLRHNADIRIMPTHHFESGAHLAPLQFKSA
ncbi:hypothetical protein KKH16_03395, partial [Patescibacteria group bacterium]|nr:hypothetical protein [Patescibacteria group bacterium]